MLFPVIICCLHPLLGGRVLLVALGGVGSGGVLCENCIVDASIFIFLCVTDRHPGGGGWLFFVRVLVHRPAMFVVGCCVFVVRAHGGCLGMLGR